MRLQIVVKYPIFDFIPSFLVVSLKYKAFNSSTTIKINQMPQPVNRILMGTCRRIFDAKMLMEHT